MKSTRVFQALVLLLGLSAGASATERYSFLWVIDNSGSMAQRHRILAQKFAEFMKTAQGDRPFAYRMAVTTTDQFSQAPVKIVDSESADPVGDFAAILNNLQDSATSFWEQGLEAGYQVIEKNGAELLTPKAPLFVLYLTDEDDYSCADHCWGVEPEHNPDWRPFPTGRYWNQFRSLSEQGNQVSVFPIVGVPASLCATASLGYRYMVVQPEGGFGLPFSVCGNELAKSLQSVAEIIAKHH